MDTLFTCLPNVGLGRGYSAQYLMDVYLVKFQELCYIMACEYIKHSSPLLGNLIQRLASDVLDSFAVKKERLKYKFRKNKQDYEYGRSHFYTKGNCC